MRSENPNKLKHLEFIQLVITRMNVNSFLIKGWAMTVFAALYALSAKDSNFTYILITFITIPIFWSLDGFYLSKENRYRKLYNEVIDKKEEDIDFNLDATKFKNGKCNWFLCMFTYTLFLFYFMLLLITFLIIKNKDFFSTFAK